LDDDPVVAGENASDLALVPLCQEFDAHSGIITDILFGSGSAGLGLLSRVNCSSLSPSLAAAKSVGVSLENP
jgi:hypothetical protein